MVHCGDSLLTTDEINADVDKISGVTITREEAIKILNFQRGYFCDLKGCEEQQAFTMAIKALEPEPCEDCISRELALEKMADYVASGYADSAEDFEEYSKIICQLPPVEPKQSPYDGLISRKAVNYMIEQRALKAKPNAMRELQSLQRELMYLPSVEQKRENMTVEEYRKRMMDAFHNADCGELIALVVLPTEKEFEHLEWLLKEFWNKREQKQGKWIKSTIPNEDYVCSECGGACWYYDVKKSVAQSRFCPNCGIQMQGGEE